MLWKRFFVVTAKRDGKPVPYFFYNLYIDFQKHLCYNNIKQMRTDTLSVRSICIMVGATGLEPAASCSQSKHSTKLSYAPTIMPIYDITLIG